MPPLSPSNRCFPARSFMDGSWTTCPSQFVQHEQRCATADCAIGQIECRPMPAAQIDVEKVNHMAVQQPIDHIPKRAAQSQCQCETKNGSVTVFSEQRRDQKRSNEANGGE